MVLLLLPRLLLLLLLLVGHSLGSSGCRWEWVLRMRRTVGRGGSFFAIARALLLARTVGRDEHVLPMSNDMRDSGVAAGGLGEGCCRPQSIGKQFL